MKNIVVSRIRQFIREDWLRKIIAVFFAVLIYVTGMESISEEKTWHNIPVEVSLPAGLVDTNPKPIFVSVTVRGSKRNLRNQDKLSGKVQVLERKFVNGEPYRLTISPDNFAPVKGVRVVSVDFKDQIHSLMLQRQVTRRLPVRAVFTGELPADFACDKVVCIPQDVEVIGPESLVCDLTDVVTEAIPLDSSLTESFSIKTKLRNPNALTIGAKNDSVEVQVTVVRKFTEKKFRNIPLQIPEQQQQSQTVRSAGKTGIQHPVLILPEKLPQAADHISPILTHPTGSSDHNFPQ